MALAGFWLCPLISLAFMFLNIPYFIFYWSLLGTSHTTFSIAYILTTIDHTHSLQGYLTPAMRLPVPSSSIPKVLVWVSICLPVGLWVPLGTLPWQCLSHWVYGQPFLHLFLKLLFLWSWVWSVLVFLHQLFLVSSICRRAVNICDIHKWINFVLNLSIIHKEEIMCRESNDSRHFLENLNRHSDCTGLRKISFLFLYCITRMVILQKPKVRILEIK